MVNLAAFPTRGKRILRLTEGKTIDILAKPDTVSADQWMPSSNLSISDNWSNNLPISRSANPLLELSLLTLKGLQPRKFNPCPSNPVITISSIRINRD